MPIQLYHPNKSNSGYAFSVNLAPDNSCVYMTLIRQHGWDAEKGNGTFKGNKDNPEQRVNIKLSFVEAAAILETIERSRPWSTYHDADKPKQIKFEVWKDKTSGEAKGYTFSVLLSDKQDANYKNSFFFGFTFAEGRYLREYLIFCLRRSFKAALAAQALKSQWVKPVESVPVARAQVQPVAPKEDVLVDL